MRTFLIIILVIGHLSSLYGQNNASKIDELFLALVEEHNGVKYTTSVYTSKAAKHHSDYLLQLAKSNPTKSYKEIHYRNPHYEYNYDSSPKHPFHSAGDRVIHYLKGLDNNVSYTAEIINYIGFKNVQYTDEQLAQMTLDSYLSSAAHKKALENIRFNVISSRTWIISRNDGYTWVQNVTVFADEDFTK